MVVVVVDFVVDVGDIRTRNTTRSCSRPPKDAKQTVDLVVVVVVGVGSFSYYCCYYC